MFKRKYVNGGEFLSNKKEKEGWDVDLEFSPSFETKSSELSMKDLDQRMHEMTSKEQPTTLKKQKKRKSMLWRLSSQPTSDGILSDDCEEYENLIEFSDQIACGTYGCVYGVPKELRQEIAKQYHGRDVVVKFMKYSKLHDDEEIKVSALAGDQKIGPRIYDVLYCQSTAAIVMERLDLSLYEYMKRRKNQTLQTPSNTQRQEKVDFLIAQRLRQQIEKLHRLGYQHNDLHTANVMLMMRDPNDLHSVYDVRLIDFGFVKPFDPDMLVEYSQLVGYETNLAETGWFQVFDFANWQHLKSYDYANNNWKQSNRWLQKRYLDADNIPRLPDITTWIYFQIETGLILK